jgi:hypothetical protein
MAPVKKSLVEIHEIQYIMVSNLDKHWDAIATDKSHSYYSRTWIDALICRTDTPQEAVTLFIRKYKDGTPDKSWFGKSYEFKRMYSKRNQYTISFKISEIKPISCPPIFKKHPIGWHLNNKHITANNHLIPQFLEEMSTTVEWRLFELYCHYLLKLLGINHLHSFPHIRNRGKADGQFILKDLYVVYDATLRDDFLEAKRDQILLFTNKLKKARTVSIGDCQFPLKDIQKQIWIITRGNESCEITSPDINNGTIVIKEVPFTKLVMLYYTRLHEEISETELCKRLKDI